MRANPQNHTSQVSPTKRYYWIALIAGLLVLAVFLGRGLWDTQAPSEEDVAAAQRAFLQPSPQRDIKPALDIPVKPVLPAPQSALTADVPIPAVPPATPDELLTQELDLLGLDGLLLAFVSDQNPVDVSAALLDGLSRGLLLRKILPASPPAEPFAVVRKGGAAYMGLASYQRYDVYADAIASLDVELIATSFHRLRGIYEAAYSGLGLDPADFDNAIIGALDIVLATPVVTDPVALERTSVMYSYADPALEQLPSLQKQLLRTGPDNTRRIQQVARSLRDKLLQQ